MAAYCSNANGAAWHEVGEKNPKGAMKDIKYRCVRQKCQCKAVRRGKQGENSLLRVCVGTECRNALEAKQHSEFSMLL